MGSRAESQLLFLKIILQGMETNIVQECIVRATCSPISVLHYNNMLGNKLVCGFLFIIICLFVQSANTRLPTDDFLTERCVGGIYIIIFNSITLVHLNPTWSGMGTAVFCVYIIHRLACP